MTDNAIITRDGASAGNIQETLATVDDSGTINVPAGQGFTVDGTAVTVPSDISGGTITPATGDVDLSGTDDGYVLTQDASGNASFEVNPGASGLTSSVTTLTPTTGNDTATVTDDVNFHFADVSGMTADRSFVVPAGTAKQEIVLNITTGDDAYEYVIIGDTGISINGGSAATEWSRLFITGESIRLVATSTSNWQVVNDGRIPCHGQMTLSANDTTNTAATATLPTWDNAVINVGNICDTTNYRFNIRRAGTYRVSGDYRSNGNIADQKYVFIDIYVNGTGGTRVSLTDGRQSIASPSTTLQAAISPKSFACAVGDYVDYWYRPEDANMGIHATKSFFELIET